MSTDIVTTLRRESFYRPTSRINSGGKAQIGFELMSINLQAADEIERLRAELVSTTNKLTAERDDARRIACEKEAWLRRENGSARDHAERMGWGCFKENTDD